MRYSMRSGPVADSLAPRLLLSVCLVVVSVGVQAGASAAAASVERGAQLFQHYCTQCHGQDGRAQLDVISDATDLTDPEAYYSGNSPQDIFNSVANGTGVAMPGWRAQLGSDEAIWDLVNFIRSLWAE